MLTNRSLFPLVLALASATGGCSTTPPAYAPGSDPVAQAPTQGGESDGDLAITQQIHNAVRSDPSLSPSARRVTVITLGRVVTLRGNVTTNRERDTIFRHARDVAGVERVENALSVRTSPHD